MSVIAAIPVGTLTKKIARQDSAWVSRPPASGPADTAAAEMAPQAPSATPRSRPWNSWAIRASEVPNIIAPPMPCAPRARSSHSGLAASPDISDAAVNTARPAVNTRRRPIRSASDPAASSAPARVSA